MAFALRMKTKSVSSSGVHVLVHFGPTARRDDRVANELHDRLERAHEPGRDQPVLPEIPPHRQGDDEEDGGRDDPQHEHVLGHREIDPGDGGQVNERVIEAAVGDVLDDHFAGIEPFGGGFGRVLGCLCFDLHHPP